MATNRIVAAAPPSATEMPDKRPYRDVLWMVRTVTGPGETVLVSKYKKGINTDSLLPAPQMVFVTHTSRTHNHYTG